MTGKHPGHAYIRNNRQAKLPAELIEAAGKRIPRPGADPRRAK